MKCPDCLESLDACLDGETAPALAAEIEAHLAGCPACREQLRHLRELRAAAAALPREVSPARDLWPEIAAQLAPAPKRRVVPFPSGWLAAAAALAVLAGAVLVWQSRSPAAAFSVTRLEGAPRIGRAVLADEGQLRVGQWLETDAGSTARVAVAAIGTVTLQPNSRLRLIETSPAEHRLELVRGKLEAFVVAPPRLFVVETPAATAIDLGCAYTIAVDDSGGGLLHVTSGYVALARGDREVIVGAGMMCAMRPGLGAGTPFGDDAPQPLRTALARLDFESLAALPEVLAAARPQADALTLWHLLSRVSGTERGTIYDLLAAAEMPPAGVTRAGIVAGDQTMLDTWGQHFGDQRGLWNVVKVKKG